MKHPASVWYLGVTLLLGLSLFILIPHWDVDSWRSLIRTTARTSLLFFLAAYTASSLSQRWPSRVTLWMRDRRKQWGLLLLASHLIHLLGIMFFWQMAPDAFAQQVSKVNLITGGVAYLFLFAMGLTSHPALAKRLGAKPWAHLHTWGMHYLLLSFLVANGKRIPIDNIYVLPTMLLALGLGIRVMARQRVALRPH